MNIFLFSRAVHSGKTTELLNWCSGRTDVRGILMPDVDGKRRFLDLKSHQMFDAETEMAGPVVERVITVGKYTFLHSSFEKANQIICSAADEQPHWLMIDECGKLELQKKGLYPGILHVFNTYTAGNLLLVVRDDLVQDVVSLFGISGYRLIRNVSEI